MILRINSYHNVSSSSMSSGADVQESRASLGLPIAALAGHGRSWRLHHREGLARIHVPWMFDPRDAVRRNLLCQF